MRPSRRKLPLPLDSCGYIVQATLAHVNISSMLSSLQRNHTCSSQKQACQTYQTASVLDEKNVIFSMWHYEGFLRKNAGVQRRQYSFSFICSYTLSNTTCLHFWKELLSSRSIPVVNLELISWLFIHNGSD